MRVVGLLLLLLLLECPPQVNSCSTDDTAVLATLKSLLQPLNWIGLNPCLYSGVSCDSQNCVTGLNLRGLSLTGSLPVQIGSLPHLKALDLSSNRFTDNIPVEFNQLAVLTSLNVSNNALVGGLENVIGLADLTTLDASHNNISGEVTFNASASNLDFVDISHNNLTSFVLPFSVDNTVDLPSLTTLNLSYNKINGLLPYVIFDRNVTIDVSSNRLCGIPPLVASSMGTLNLNSNCLGIASALPNWCSIYGSNCLFMKAAASPDCSYVCPFPGSNTALVQLVGLLQITLQTDASVTLSPVGANGQVIDSSFTFSVSALIETDALFQPVADGSLSLAGTQLRNFYVNPLLDTSLFGVYGISTTLDNGAFLHIGMLASNDAFQVYFGNHTLNISAHTLKQVAALEYWPIPVSPQSKAFILEYTTKIQSNSVNSTYIQFNSDVVDPTGMASITQDFSVPNSGNDPTFSLLTSGALNVTFKVVNYVLKDGNVNAGNFYNRLTNVSSVPITHHLYLNSDPSRTVLQARFPFVPDRFLGYDPDVSVLVEPSSGDNGGDGNSNLLLEIILPSVLGGVALFVVVVVIVGALAYYKWNSWHNRSIATQRQVVFD